MAETISQVKCGGCAKVYAWKPEFAGKRLKCKCGAAVNPPGSAKQTRNGVTTTAAKTAASAPANARAAAPRPSVAARPVVTPKPAHQEPSPEEALSDFERAIAEAEYDVAPAEPAVAPVPPPRIATVVPPSPGGTVASPALGYARMAKRRPAEDEGTQAGRVHDLYIPIALIVAGVGLAYVDAYLMGIHNPAIASIYVILVSALNLVLVFLALMAGVKLLDLGLGPIGTAILKITAVAILPAAVSGIIGNWTLGLMSWSISAVCYYLLLFYLFDMDFREMMIITTIIWGIRFFLRLFVMIAIMKLLGAAGPGAAAGKAWSHGVTSAVDPTGTGSDAHPETPAEVDADATREIQSGNAVEAREWLNPELKNHVGFKLGNQPMTALANRFYIAGAVKVWASDIQNVGPNQMCGQFLVEMPDDPEAREKVRKIFEDFSDERIPNPDAGGHYLVVRLD